jgi:hypothetical protein
MTTFVPLGGSVMKSSIKDFTHLMHWSHRDHCPVPQHGDALTEWSEALDENVNGMLRREPGVLLGLYPVQDLNGIDTSDQTVVARKVFFERCSRTPGIVVSDTKDAYTGSLTLSALEYTPNAKTDENFKKLRTEMQRPDGWALAEAIQAWAVARQLAIGLHYDWSPRPPPEWLDARKLWAQFVRDTLAKPSANRMGLDTELQVANAVLDNKLADDYGLLAAWREIKPTFVINSVPVWHDDTALKLCCDWLADHPKGIAWCEHRHFAAALSKMSGIAYYGAKGLDKQGNFIQDATGPVIASIAANSTGRNLQDKWCDNLVTAAPADSERWEQLIGRTHRLGQRADAVTVDVLVGCREHLEAVPRAVSSAEVKKDLLGFSQKLRLADITNWPDLKGRTGWAWA